LVSSTLLASALPIWAQRSVGCVAVFTRPRDLTDDTLARLLADGWAIATASLEYAAVGFGSHHWSVDAGDQRWFVTVDDLDAKKRCADDSREVAFERLRDALSAAHFAADRGLEFVVAPLAATDGTVLWRVADRYAVAVYPYLDGTSYPYGAFPSDDHRRAVLSMLARLHDVADRAATGAQTDDLVVPRSRDLITAIDELDERWDAGPYGEPARRLLVRHASAVERLFEHYDDLAETIAGHPESMVLTHGEPHPANTLRTAHGWLLVDWDTTLIASPERDLWAMASGDAAVVNAYQAMTGREVRQVGLDCYRLWWDLAEICWYIALLRDLHTDDTDVRESWHNLQHYLDPPARWPELM
jgi:spectinomycin phosphotransferase